MGPDPIPVLAVCLAVGFSPGLALAQQAERPALTVTRLADGVAPTIDGKVDDEAWNGARAYSTFTQQEPNEPDRIIVSQSRRDAALEDTDSIEILLDTFNDGQNDSCSGRTPSASSTTAR